MVWKEYIIYIYTYNFECPWSGYSRICFFHLHWNTVTTSGFFWSFLNEQPLANITSFAAVAPKFRITIDTELDPFIIVHLHNITRILLKQCGAGIYYIYTTNKAFTEDQTPEYTFLDTVERNNSFIHRWEIKGADKAIILQQHVVLPSTQSLK